MGREGPKGRKGDRDEMDTKLSSKLGKRKTSLLGPRAFWVPLPFCVPLAHFLRPLRRFGRYVF